MNGTRKHQFLLLLVVVFSALFAASFAFAGGKPAPQPTPTYSWSVVIPSYSVNIKGHGDGDVQYINKYHETPQIGEKIIKSGGSTYKSLYITVNDKTTPVQVNLEGISHLGGGCTYGTDARCEAMFGAVEGSISQPVAPSTQRLDIVFDITGIDLDTMSQGQQIENLTGQIYISEGLDFKNYVAGTFGGVTLERLSDLENDTAVWAVHSTSSSLDLQKLETLPGTGKFRGIPVVYVVTKGQAGPMNCDLIFMRTKIN